MVLICLFAVIDIETTGGNPSRDRITEIAIILHNGQTVTDTFTTLVNPECRIPSEIQRLTGITNEMVENAPRFYEIAKRVVEMTEGAVFVAHNVRFDYSFVKAAFSALGYMYQRETICTVRLSRKAFKGLPSYSLGKLCETLNIPINGRHRAYGDAEATAIILGRILAMNTGNEKNWVKIESKATHLPPMLSEKTYSAIPEGITGVYYFHDKNGHIIYVGKALDIKKRLQQHFSMGSKGSSKSIKMKNEIADISYEPTGDELVALLLESDEIKKLKPIYNVLQKRAGAIPYYGIFNEYDALGYINLKIRRLKDGDEPIYTADNHASARAFLQTLAERFELCQSKNDLHHMPGPCFYFHLHQCKGACTGEEDPLLYNKRAADAIGRNSFQRESFLVIGKGRMHEEKSVICVERGIYKGFGYMHSDYMENNMQALRQSIKPYPHNRDIQQILCTYLKRGHSKITYNPEELNQYAG